MEQLLTKIFSRFVITETGCWEWRGARTQAGYGVINDWSSRKNRYVHRIVLEAIYGAELPRCIVAMHSCDNPPCCYPGHLSAGTVRDHARLTEEAVLDIRARVEAGTASRGTLAREYGVSKVSIRNVIKRLTWAHI